MNNDKLGVPEIETLFSNKLSASEIYNKILDNLTDGVCIFEVRDTIHALYVNEQYYKAIGYNKHDNCEKILSDVTAALFKSDTEKIMEKAAECQKSGGQFKYIAKGYNSDNRIHWYQIKAICVDFIQSDYPVFLALISDISKQKMLEHHLAVDKARYRIFEETTESILFDYNVFDDVMNFSHNQSGVIRRWSITDYKNAPSVVHPSDREKFNKALLSACCKPIKGELEYRTHIIDSEKSLWCRTYYSSIADESGAVTNVLGRIKNIDHEITKRNDILKKAECDPLTGVYNRLTAKQKIEKRLSKSFEIAYFAVIDIDNFKKFNDIYGHMFGDNVLITVSNKLKLLFPNGVVSRFGGDEFIIYTDKDNKDEVYDKLKKLSDETYCIKNNQKVPITFSIGVAASIHKISYTEFLSEADKIMYDVKKNGKDSTIIRNIDIKDDFDE